MKSLFLVLLFLFVGCGKKSVYEDKIVKTNAPITNSEDTYYTDSLTENHVLPIVVNGATISTVVDEADTAAHLFAPMDSNPVGSFNGGGVGNKAFLGLFGFNSFKLSDLTSISFSFKQIQPTQLLYINLQIDMNCNGIYDVGTDKIWAPSIPVDTTLNTWLIYYADKSTLGATYPGAVSKTLNQILVSNPSACLFDGLTSDGGMPKLVETKALMVVVSDSSNLSHVKEVLIDNIKILIGGRIPKTYNFGF